MGRTPLVVSEMRVGALTVDALNPSTLNRGGVGAYPV